jgi:hypothetical protein
MRWGGLPLYKLSKDRDVSLSKKKDRWLLSQCRRSWPLSYDEAHSSTLSMLSVLRE